MFNRLGASRMKKVQNRLPKRRGIEFKNVYTLDEVQ